MSKRTYIKRQVNASKTGIGERNSPVELYHRQPTGEEGQVKEEDEEAPRWHRLPV